MARLTSIVALIAVIAFSDPCRADTKTTVPQSNIIETVSTKRLPEKNDNTAQTNNKNDAQMFQTGSPFFKFPQVIPAQQTDPAERIQRPNRQQPNLQQYIPNDLIPSILTSILLNNQKFSKNDWDNLQQTIKQFNNQLMLNGNMWDSQQQSIQQLNNQQSKTNNPIFGQVPNAVLSGIQGPASQADLLLGCPLAQQPFLYNSVTNYLDSNGYKTQTTPRADISTVQNSILDVLSFNPSNLQPSPPQQQINILQSLRSPPTSQSLPSNFYPGYSQPSAYPVCQYPHCQVPCGTISNTPGPSTCCLPFCSYPPLYDSNSNPLNNFNVPPYNNNLSNNYNDNAFVTLSNNQRKSTSSENNIFVDNSTNIDRVKIADNSVKDNTVSAGNQLKSSKSQFAHLQNEDNDDYLNSLFVPVWIGPEKKYRYLTGPKDLFT